MSRIEPCPPINPWWPEVTSFLIDTNSFSKHVKLKLPLVNRTKSLSPAKVRNHEMLLSAIYGILFAACWVYANFQLCCATDEAVDEQTARICMENCSHLTKDVYTTPLSSEVRNHTGNRGFLSLEYTYASSIDYYNQVKVKNNTA